MNWVWLAVLACATSGPARRTSGPVAGVHSESGGAVKRVATVAYRPIEPPGEDAAWLVAAVPQSTWDQALAGAAVELIGTLRSPDRMMSPRAMATATARTGFPGTARFAKTITTGRPPADLVDNILGTSGGRPVDVGLAKRAFGNGTVLWIVAWAPHIVDMDPVPRSVNLDSSVMLRIDRLTDGDARLFVAPPDAPVRELSLTSGIARWVGGFDVPGEYRFEVVSEDDGMGELALLFSVFADQQPRAMPRAPEVPTESADPRKAEAWLFDQLNAMRMDHGLRPVKLFPLFDQFTREHSALMGHAGLVAHSLPRYGTVEDRAGNVTHPRAKHYQNVAAAPTASDALKMVVLSPAHLQNLLCESCTHASIGASLEPVLDRIPRLFVTWELLEFPLGAPQEIDHFNR
jgi:hypothetical protein